MDKNKPENTALEQVLASLGLPDDLPEVALAGSPEPSPEALRRIKARTLARLPQACPARRNKPLFRQRFSPAATAAAALLLTVSLALAWAGPSRVWAGVQQMLALVPGFGWVESGADEGWILYARQKVRRSGGDRGGFVEVSGLLANSRYTGLQLYCENLPGYAPEPDPGKEQTEADRQQSYAAAWEPYFRLYLLDDADRRYYLSPEAPRSMAGGGASSQAWLQFPPLDRSARRVTLVLPLDGTEELTVEIPLALLESDAERGEIGGSATRHGITVSAAAFAYADTWVAVAVDLGDRAGRVAELGRYFTNLPADRPVTLTGRSGQPYPRASRGLGGWGVTAQNYTELFFTEAAEGEKQVRLEIPLLQICEAASARVKITVPGSGSLDLDQAVALGRFPLRLTRAETILDGEQRRLRIYVDLGPAGPETLERFTLGGSRSWSCKFNAVSGRMEYLEIPLDGNPTRLALTLTDPVYSVAGPWVLELPLQR